MTTTIDIVTARWISGWVLAGDQTEFGSPAGAFDADEIFPEDGALTTSNPATFSSAGGVLSNSATEQFGYYDQPDSITQAAIGPNDVTPRVAVDLDVAATPDRGDFWHFAAGGFGYTALAPGDAAVTVPSYTADAIADWMAGSAWPASTDRYFALLDTTGTEVAGGSYARVALLVYGTDYLFAGLPSVTVRYWALYDAAAAGNQILRVQLASDLVVPAGDRFRLQTTYPPNFLVHGAP